MIIQKIRWVFQIGQITHPNGDGTLIIEKGGPLNVRSESTIHMSNHE